MKNKLAVGLALALILTLSVGLMGCEGTVTGGGFLGERGDKVTFGFSFNASGESIFDYDVEGQFQLVDHNDRPPTRIHGTFYGILGNAASGLCTIKGPYPEGPHPFTLYVEDWGEPGIDDYIYVYLVIPGGGSGNDLVYEGTIDGGNIQVHEDDD